MVKRVSAASAKAHLSELTAEVAYGGERVIIERHGKPIAALVSVDELELLERETHAAKGLMSAVGAWSVLDDSEIDTLVEDIYAARETDLGRPVDLGN